MHPNPAFRGTPTERNIAFARHRGFGTLAIGGPDGPLLAHVPFLLKEDGASADLHLVRSNPIARLELPSDAAIAVAGADGYVSPDWYGVDDQVPTWNYVAVHLRGRLRPLPSADLLGVLDRLSAHFEGDIAGKSPWTADKMTPAVMERMMRQILPFRLEVESIDGTWKLSQNKPDDVRLRAADHVGQAAASEASQLARLMRHPPEA